MHRQINVWGDQFPNSAALSGQIEVYWNEITTAAMAKPLLDRDLAAKIRTSLVAAINAWDSIELDDRPWLAAAVVYFVESDDDEHDLDSPVGFDDDAEVVNAVMAMIGRKDLMIQ
jgi:uncharacterized membrane protein YkvA (DUF1232 family)